MSVRQRLVFQRIAQVPERLVVIVLLGLALALRFYMVLHTYVIANDGTFYVNLAQAIARGETGAAYDRYLFNLYPLVMVPFQRVFHDWELSGQMVSAVFGSLTVVPFYLLTRDLFKKHTALIASVLFVFHPYLVRYSGEVVREPTFWFFVLMTLWVGWRAINHKHLWLFAIAGLFGGLAFFVRIEGILLLPLLALWVILKDPQVFWKTYRRRILSVLILLLSAPVIASPTMIYLKTKTGHWGWSKIRQVPGITSFGVTLKEIKRNLDRLDLKRWDEGLSEAEVIRLRDFLFMARDHRIGIVGLELLRRFSKTLHPLLVLLLLVGAVRRKRMPYHSHEFYPLSFVVGFLVVLFLGGCVFFYIGTRHMATPIMLCLPWVGVGVTELEWRVRNAFLRVKPGGIISGFIDRDLRWVLVCLVVLALVPKTLAPQRAEKVPIKKAGLWMRDHGPRGPIVMTQGQLRRAVFYANGVFVAIPGDEDLVAYAKERAVDFLAFNEKSIGLSHPGLLRSVDSGHFQEVGVFGQPSGTYVIRVFTVKNEQESIP
jgi:4-amino-4-deoxy-L-arabinose transferase-like glycosyltransferase